MVDTTERALELVIGMAGEGVDFFRYAEHHEADPVRATQYGHSARQRLRLLKRLQALGLIDDPTREHQPWAIDDPALSYAALRATFGVAAPDDLAEALRVREHTLKHLLARLAREHADPAVRRAMRREQVGAQRAQSRWALRAALAAA